MKRKILCIIVALAMVFASNKNTFFAISDIGEVSAATSEAPATTEENAVKPIKKIYAPTRLKTKIKYGQVVLSWHTRYSKCKVELYRSVRNKKHFKLYDTIICSSQNTSYTDTTVVSRTKYFYKIRIVEIERTITNTDGSVDYDTFAIQSKFKTFKKAYIKAVRPELTSVKGNLGRSITLKFKSAKGSSGYDIYRSTTKAGIYKHIKSIKEKGKLKYIYEDKNLVPGQVYYYVIRAYRIKGTRKIEKNYSCVKRAIAGLDQIAISNVTSTAKGANTITWAPIENADGYILYGTSDTTRGYKILTEIKGNENLSFTHKGLLNGTKYFYEVHAYKNTEMGITKSESPIFDKVCSYFAYDGETKEEKCMRVFGTNTYKGYTSAAEANSHMTTLSIKVWDISPLSTKKVTRRFDLTVNTALAPTVKQMFKEIYNSKQQTPIHAIGAYSYRGGRTEHNEGLAIDINPDENYMIDNGTILAGSFWNPKKSPYSIPLKCDLVKIMKKYGFSRGFWHNRKDYMHFSYFGT